MVGIVKGETIMKKMISLISLVMVFLLLGCVSDETIDDNPIILSTAARSFFEFTGSRNYVARLIYDEEGLNQLRPAISFQSNYDYDNIINSMRRNLRLGNKGYIVAIVDLQVGARVETSFNEKNGFMQLVITHYDTSVVNGGVVVVVIIPVVLQVDNVGRYNIIKRNGDSVPVNDVLFTSDDVIHVNAPWSQYW